ncbi:uncharacterized protein LOC127877685 isoform X2 [Dreissena polymorpha]|uniref:Uncharacterized protein n=1 Tax=Dreissena polymorpha TaxID=45954 RepID=A0A9D4QKH5_DREPO|nr:uncharacterized protein LOC127877685 isoform X2 [Dreissena polymorpha]KAH3834449.1 hypothetical protein DPMN_107775 [Dreissena polymorpha]
MGAEDCLELHEKAEESKEVNEKKANESKPVSFKQDFESKTSEAAMNGDKEKHVQPITSFTAISPRDNPQEQSSRKTERLTNNKNESTIEVISDKSTEERINVEEGNCEMVKEVLTYKEFYKKYMKKPVYDVTCLMLCYTLCMTTELGLDLYRVMRNQTIIQTDIDGLVLVISDATFGLLSLMISSVFLKRFWKRRDKPLQKEELPPS